MKNEYWDIIAKHVFKEPLESNEKTFIDLAKDDEDLSGVINDAEKIKNDLDKFYSLGQYDTDKAWKVVNSQTSTKTIKLPWKNHLTRIAAVFVFLALTSVLVWYYASGNNMQKHAIALNDLSRPEVILSDGSIVIMNSGSEISYPKKFKKNHREIHLQGEAFFKVAHNTSKPFIVKAQGATVKVLGTSFSVNANNTNKTVEVVVETGSVELISETIDNNRPGASTVLRAGQKGLLQRITGEIITTPVSQPNALSWATRKIEFRTTPISEAISLLENIYGINIDLLPDVDLQKSITATFNQNEESYVLDVIALTLNLEINPTGEKYYTVRNKK